MLFYCTVDVYMCEKYGVEHWFGKKCQIWKKEWLFGSNKYVQLLKGFLMW
jgi:hypothetical protein